MANMEKFGKLRQNIGSHSNMWDRINAAQTMKKDAGKNLEGCTILVDPMDDRANISYAALPERLYVILDDRVIYQGGLGPFSYDLCQLETFLAKRK